MSVSEDATVTSKGQVTIPKRIRDKLELEEGTEIEFVLGDEGTLEIRPKKPAMDQLRDVRESLASHDIDLDAMRQESKNAWRSHGTDEEST
ncbi:AbrB/MazE/SpoVT family DNA-binding domain-containing protein [Natronorubrum daqingense]|uniref:AbrB family transcriptional regulator n=1 Tax=Natronorubrum daqingense TaxID=588898 RepID=A0A1N7BSG1_9EURY|nr:AbrB/MazE/SpoVT family DNA-binding domain-containing protein [Natronorubrum daqingense]APX96581.1 AbrB family transcriptional regulator [Natronorubrum daqingense]SIR54258.1 looped-hinge helix DNA binding domain-containing protein, AbrB family [Natronorubrum daqingense]